MNTSSRATELAWLEKSIQWLPLAEARVVYDRANRWMSTDSYCLNERQFPKTDTTTADDVETCRAWLADRIHAANDLLIIFGPREVCATTPLFFLDHWQDMFGPARDDVLITDMQESWVLFYYHEDQFQFARIENA